MKSLVVVNLGCAFITGYCALGYAVKGDVMMAVFGGVMVMLNLYLAALGCTEE